MYGAPEYGGQPRRRGVGGHRVPRRRPAPGLERRRGGRSRDRRRRHRGVGTRAAPPSPTSSRGRAGPWSSWRRVATTSSTRRPDEAGRGLLQRRDQVHLPVLPRARSPHRAAHLPPGRGGRRPHATWARSTRSPPPWAGGGTHADGKVPRFREEDFALLSTHGPIEGAEVADWPLSYDDLEPFYAEAERSIGVAGEAGANPFAAWRSGPYPMPSGAPMYGALRSSAAAETLGLHPYAAPTAANSVPYDGRPACNNCGFCAFFGCPIHAKGDPVALLTRAPWRRGTPSCCPRPSCRACGPTGAVPPVSRSSAPTVPPAPSTPATWSSPPARSRRPACCCCRASTIPWWAGTSWCTSRPSSSGSSPSASTATRVGR